MAIKKCFPYLLILFFTLGVMLFLYTYVDVAYGDTYYHLALANFIKDHGLSRQYEHLAYTVYADTFSDGHFLFHVALIPLTFLPLYWANLIGITLMTSIMLGVFYFILSKEGYSLKWIWTASFLLISWGFLFRMTQLRTIPLGIAFIHHDLPVQLDVLCISVSDYSCRNRCVLPHAQAQKTRMEAGRCRDCGNHYRNDHLPVLPEQSHVSQNSMA